MNRFEGKVVIVTGPAPVPSARKRVKPRGPLFLTASSSVGRLHPTKSRV